LLLTSQFNIKKKLTIVAELEILPPNTHFEHSDYILLSLTSMNWRMGDWPPGQSAVVGFAICPHRSFANITPTHLKTVLIQDKVHLKLPHSKAQIYAFTFRPYTCLVPHCLTPPLVQL